jgi:hypothetical protein
MKPQLLRVLGAIVLLAALLYGGDDLSLRYRIPKNREPFGSVTVQPLYVIHEKNGKVEYQFATPQDQPCIRSLVPHFGYSPCWYLSRHRQQRTDI